MTNFHENCRDHLFISYAYEDEALAEWLTRKLTSEGYFVWCDRFKLLGGESYPRDIDAAIKSRTFRVIALLSKYSISKPNPTKERTLALNLGRERKEDFLIPINVDGLRPIELDWMTSDLTFIPFNENWAEGFSRLLKKLDSIKAPKNRKCGSEVAAETFIPRQIITERPEVVYSNQLRFLHIPEVIRRFRFDHRLDRDQKIAVSEAWPVMFIDPRNGFAFRPPTTLPKGLTVTAIGGNAWRHNQRVNGVLTHNVVVWLLKRELVSHCIKKGLLPLGKDGVYFPTNFNEDEKVRFVNWEGRQTWVQVVGHRSAWRPNRPPAPYLYHLAMAFSVNRKLDNTYNLQIRLTLHITDTMNGALPTRSAVARRKAICRSWWNDSWLKRLFAMCDFLSDARDTIAIGPPGEEQILLSARPIHFTLPVSIDENLLGTPDIEDSHPDHDLIDESSDFDDE